MHNFKASGEMMKENDLAWPSAFVVRDNELRIMITVAWPISSQGYLLVFHSSVGMEATDSLHY